MSDGTKPRVVMAGPARNVRGGVSAVVNTLLAAIPEDAPDIRYIPTHVDGPTPIKVIAAAIGFARLLWALLAQKCDIVHVHMASYGSFYRKSRAAAITEMFGRKVVIHVHGAQFDLFFDQAAVNLKRMIAWRLMQADLVIALSDGWRSRLLAMAPEANIRILANPVDTRQYEGMVEARSPVPEGGGNVLFLGALTQRKGIYDLVEAAALVAAKRPDVLFELGGDREVSEVRRLVQKKGLAGNFRFMGWVRGTDKLAAFGRAHIFMLPSYHEGLPIAVLEALAAGLPLVTTPVGGIPEVVRDGINGLLVEPGDIDALAESILRLLEDSELRSGMAAENLEVARTRHDARVVARELVSWYDELVAGKPHTEGKCES